MDKLLEQVMQQQIYTQAQQIAALQVRTGVLHETLKQLQDQTANVTWLDARLKEVRAKTHTDASK